MVRSISFYGDGENEGGKRFNSSLSAMYITHNLFIRKYRYKELTSLVCGFFLYALSCTCSVLCGLFLSLKDMREYHRNDMYLFIELPYFQYAVVFGERLLRSSLEGKILLECRGTFPFSLSLYIFSNVRRYQCSNVYDCLFC